MIQTQVWVLVFWELSIVCDLLGGIWIFSFTYQEVTMPTYQYECSACGHDFEAFQSMMEKKLKKCPECGKLKLHRLIGRGSGIIFKGSGFYETDYKRKEPLPCETGSVKASQKGTKACCGEGAFGG